VSYAFDGWVLDPERRLLQRASGQVASLSPKALDALVYLLEHRGAAVSKEALLKALWPRTVVEENSVDRCISTLRRALGEAAGDNRYIATIPGRGYQFVAVVSEVAKHVTADKTPGARRPPLVWIASLAGLALLAVALVGYRYFSPLARVAERPAGIVLLVLPFQNGSVSTADALLADGMTAELMQQLTNVPGVQLLSQAAIAGARATAPDALGVARSLRATHLLQSRLERDLKELRVHATLTDVATGVQLWAKPFQAPAQESLDVEEEIARAIAQSLFRGSHAIDASTVNPTRSAAGQEAFRLLLKANALIGTTPEHIRAAFELQGRAVELDPRSALARAARANTVLTAQAFNIPSDRGLAEASRDIDEALRLDPGLGSVWAVSARLQMYYRNLLSSREAFLKALALQPDDATTRQAYSRFLAGVGAVRAAGIEAAKAHDLAPLSVPVVMNRALIRTIGGDSDGAQADLQRGIPLAGTNLTGTTPDMQAILAFRSGDGVGAARYIAASVGIAARTLGLDRLIGAVYAMPKDTASRSAAGVALARFATQVGTDDLDERDRASLAIALALAGQLDAAYSAANVLAERFNRSGIGGKFALLMWMPEMRRFRQDPRFQQLVQRIGLMEYWQRAGNPDECRLEGQKLHCS
jgi:DNA-binding winged helix-turn-helix (wHTH) protein/TolB-like protein/Tfp pilus assembly protein PilF